MTSDFNIYQQKAATYRVPNSPDEERVLGLFEEAGEVAGIYKRLVRGDYAANHDEAKDKLQKELGDVLWYVSQVALDNGFSLENIAAMNLDKLESRRLRNAIMGTGSER